RPSPRFRRQQSRLMRTSEALSLPKRFTQPSGIGKADISEKRQPERPLTHTKRTPACWSMTQAGFFVIQD
ncbi:MAG: hypothetical protein Q4B73_07420, partial [Lachnospiraceae bacterium]|nr:hypothetical protein [Lachnospiraceae bacterium]